MRGEALAYLAILHIDNPASSPSFTDLTGGSRFTDSLSSESFSFIKDMKIDAIFSIPNHEPLENRRQSIQNSCNGGLDDTRSMRLR